MNKRKSSAIMKTTTLIGRSNGVGLDADARILEHALDYAGRSSNFEHCRSRSWIKRLFGKPQLENTIHLERIHGRFVGYGHNEFVIPNQERFPYRQLKALRKMKAVLCKTQHAAEIFGALGLAVRYIGFTSEDKLVHKAQPDYGRFLHVAGRSTEKGTATILKIWESHPQWPTLTIIQNPANAPQRVPTNVKLITEYLSNDNMKLMLNQHGVHLCPSRCEGWGHYIVEAMSTRACIVTTDAPPMNELIAPERGLLVPYTSESPRHMGVAYDVDEIALEQTIAELIDKPTEEKSAIGQSARLWYEQNHTAFLKRFAQVVEELM